MNETLHTAFLKKIVNHPNANPDITGTLGKVKTVRKSVSRGVFMIYVVRKKSARVEMWIYRGSKPQQVDEAKDLHHHFRAKREAIESAFGEELNWDHGRRKTAFSIQHDYDTFLLEDTASWNQWADTMVADMNRLHAALQPHYL